MVTFYPDIEFIRNHMAERPTDGEMAFLELLTRLDEDDEAQEYDVFFQTHINLYHPDVIIVKKGYGVLVVELKDWNISNQTYRLEIENDVDDVLPDQDEIDGITQTQRRSLYGDLLLRDGNRYVKVDNPYVQARNYKNELYCIPSFHAANAIDGRAYGIVTAVVYFTQKSKSDICGLFQDVMDRYHSVQKIRTFTGVTNDGNDNSEYVLDLVKKALGRYPRTLFTEEMYRELKYHLAPSNEVYEQSFVPVLSDEQEKLTCSKAGAMQKIKGVGGSGKTLVLVNRALNAQERTNRPVLILTFNKTMVNYIKDKIAQITRNETRRYRAMNFWVIDIHEFIKEVYYQHKISFDQERRIETTNPDELLRHRFEMLNTISDCLDKFQTIMIDEAQDFKHEWFVNIKSMFLGDGGEFVVFADEKQNIYSRIGEDIDEISKLPNTGIPGRWNQLTKSYRLSNGVTELVNDYNDIFFDGLYECERIENEQMTIDQFMNVANQREDIRYKDISQADDIAFPAEEVYQAVEAFCQDGEAISPNDVAILAFDHEFIRKIEKAYMDHGSRVQTTSESYEFYQAIRDQYADAIDETGMLPETAWKEIEKQRSYKKRFFYMSPGVKKISTVESFKGWEINTVVLVLKTRQEDDIRPELIYTALTRAKKNLLILDCGGTAYSEFFREHITNHM